MTGTFPFSVRFMGVQESLPKPPFKAPVSFQFPSDDSANESTGAEDLLGHSNPVEHCSGVQLMS